MEKLNDFFWRAWCSVFNQVWEDGVTGSLWERRKHIAWLLWISIRTIKECNEKLHGGAENDTI